MLFHRKSCFLCRERSRGTGFIAFIKIIAAGDAPLGQRQGGVFRVPPPCLWTPPTPQRERGCSPLSDPKAVGLHTKNPSRFAKGFFVFRRLEAPQSLRDSSLKEGASGETASFVVCPETLPLCQGLSLWESWQARQGLTERVSQLPGAHSKSFVLSPETVQFLIFPPLKVKNPAEKRFRWFKNRFGCAILGVKVPVWTGNRRA